MTGWQGFPGQLAVRRGLQCLSLRSPLPGLGLLPGIGCLAVCRLLPFAYLPVLPHRYPQTPRDAKVGFFPWNTTEIVFAKIRRW